MRRTSLTDRRTHFDFGENWRDYARLIDESRIGLAADGVKKLFPEGLAGHRFLDIGCGSGLHSLAALRLGAREVSAIDIDENSVATTRKLLTAMAPDRAWSVQVCSVFDLDAEPFDIVYSWGVLHHTGDMWRAVEAASRLVKPGGQFAISIYSKTPLDFAWKIEKRLYTHSAAPVQWAIRQSFVIAYLAAQMLFRGKMPWTFLREYRSRGMDFLIDAHDWLGGYPYETASAAEVSAFVTKLGFAEVRSFPARRRLGLFGTGCGEFVFRRF